MSGRVSIEARSTADGSWLSLWSSPWPMIAILAALNIVFRFNQFEYLSADDLFFKHAEAGTSSLALANYINGRFVAGGLIHTLAMFDENYFRFSFALQIFAYLAFGLFAYTFVSRLRSEASSLEQTICAAIIVLHPYSIAFFSNKINYVNAIAVFAALSAAIYFYSNNGRISRTLLTAFCLCLVIGSYQTSIYFFPVFVCAYLLFQEESWRAILVRIADGAIAAFLVTALYGAIYFCCMDAAVETIGASAEPALAEIYGQPRMVIRDLQSAPFAAGVQLILIAKALTVAEPLLGGIAKWLVNLIFLFFFLNYVLETILRVSERHARFVLAKRVFLIFSMILLLGSPMHIFLLTSSYPPRIYMHIAVFWAAIFLLIMQVCTKETRRVASSCALLFALGLGLTTAFATRDAYRTYGRDLRLANRIVGSLEADRAFDPTQPIVVVGRISELSQYMGQDIVHYGVNPSKHAKLQSRLEILKEASGYALVRAGSDFTKRADEWCETQRPLSRWFVSKVMDTGSVVCLPEKSIPHRRKRIIDEQERRQRGLN